MKQTKLLSIVFLFLISLASVAALSVTITPSTPFHNQDLSCSPSGSQYVYKWFKNGVLFSDTIGSTLSSAYTTHGDVWKCEVWSASTVAMVGGKIINIPSALQGSSQVTIQNALPVTSITNGPYNGIENQSIKFIGTASDPVDGDTIVSYNWTFGDGSSSALQNPNHVYLKNGTYTVTFTATDSDNGSSTVSTTATISDIAPVANFSFTPNPVNEGAQVNFTDLSHGYDTIVAWNWVFGDGSSSALQNPNHVYLKNGTYTINLTSTDSDGVTNSSIQNIIVNDIPPIANAGANQTSLENQLVTFNGALSTGYDLPLTYVWSFSNGTVFGNTVSPSYTFLLKGTYAINLTITDTDGVSASNITYVQVSDVAPNTAFTQSATTITENQSITFTDLSTPGTPLDPIVSQLWNFGDGQTSNQTNPTHTYLKNGTYPVTLMVTDSDGVGFAPVPQQITVNDIAPIANFTISLSGAPPLPVYQVFVNQTLNFTDNSYSYDNIASRLWDFGDGNISTSQNPTYQYSTPGTYNIDLTVTDSDGVSNTSATQTVLVVPMPAPSTFSVSFNGADTNPTNLGNITFSGFTAVVNGVDTIITNETPLPVTATGVYPGNYTVTYTPLNSSYVFDSWNTTGNVSVTSPNSQTTNISVNGNGAVTAIYTYDNVVANFNISIQGFAYLHGSSVNVNDTLNFTDTSSSPYAITNWTWNFGDGSTSNLQNPTHQYLVNGTYNVTLTATDAEGVSGTSATQSVIVVPIPGPPLSLYSVSFDGIDTNASNPSDIGSVTFNVTVILNGIITPESLLMSLPNTTPSVVYSGNYTVTYNPLNASYVFDSWNTTGNVSVTSPNSQTTNISVNGNGAVTAIYTYNSTAVVIPPVNDTSAPVISNVNVSDITNESAIINWTTNEATNSTLVLNGLTFVSGTSYSVPVSNLTNSTTYYYNITACNMYINCSSAGPFQFTTLNNNGSVVIPPGNDTSTPFIVLSNVTATNDSVTLDWATSEITNSTLDIFGVGTFTNDTTQYSSVFVPGLVNSTTYNYNITACNIYNNCTIAGPFSFTTLNNNGSIVIPPINMTNSTAAPVISNVTNSSITNSSVIIGWNTDILANSTLNLFGVRTFNQAGTSFSVIPLALLNATTYSYNITACNVNLISNCSTAGPFSFTTLQNNGTVVIPPVNVTNNIFNSTINSVYYPANASYQITSVAIDSQSGINDSTANVITSINISTVLGGSMVIANSLFNCTIIGSIYENEPSYNCLNEVIDPSTVMNSVTTGSTITNSTVLNSNATYSTIINDYLSGANINDSHVIDSLVNNSAVQDSTVSQSNITNGSSVTESSTIIGSSIDGSSVNNSQISNSTISDNSNIYSSTITNSTVSDSNVSSSTIASSTISGSTVQNSQVTGSDIENSTVINDTLVNVVSVNSTITNSNLNNVNATNSFIDNTTATGVVFTNANVSNGNLVSGNMTINNVTYTGPVNGIPPQSPVVSFSYAPSTIYPADIVFTPTVSDANGPLIYSWTFGDGTNLLNSSHSSVPHSYTAIERYTVTLKVTDNIGLSANATETNVDVQPMILPESSSGGGLLNSVNNPTIVSPQHYLWNITQENPLTKSIREIDTIMFVYQGTTYSLLVDKIGTGNEVMLRLSPSDATRTGYLNDVYNFNVKDRQLLVTNLGVNYEQPDQNTNVNLKLFMTEPTATPLVSTPSVPQQVANGVIKISGEIAHGTPSVPVGVGVSIATVVIGLLLFLGIRKIWQ